MTNRLILLTLLLTPLMVQGGSSGAERVWRSPGKLGAPVELAEQPRYEARVGETLQVALNFVTRKPALALRVEVNADEGLLLHEPLLRMDLGAVQAGRIELPAVTVTALRAGRAALNVTVFMDTGAGQRMRSFAVPVTIPDTAARSRKRADIATDDNGRAVRILPGVETH